MLVILMLAMPRATPLMDKRFSFIDFRGHNHSSGKHDVQADQTKERFFQLLNDNLRRLGIGFGTPNARGNSYERQQI